MTESDLLTIEEVAELLRVSRDTVYRLASRGELPGNKVGRIWRFPREAIEEWASRRFGEERGQRELVEEELARSEARYHDLYENAPDMFATVELPGGRIVECNQTLAILSGYRREELLGRPVLELYDPADAPRAQQWLEDLAARGEGPETELAIRRKDGEPLEASLRASAMRDESGQVIRGRLVWRDIRDRKRVEWELLETQASLERRVADKTSALQETNRQLQFEEERIRSLLETACVAMIVLHEGRILEWNCEAEQIFGWKREEVLRQLFADRFLPAGERPVFQAAVAAAVKGVPRRGLETSVLSRYGDDRFVLWNLNAQPGDSHGQSSGVLACGQDITELVESRDALTVSERRFREIAEVVGAVFWVEEFLAPGTFEVRYVSPAFETIWGRTRESIYENQQEWLEGILPEERAGVAKRFYKLTEGEPFEARYHIRRPDGTTRLIYDRGRGVYDARGRLIRVVGIAEDVTERVGWTALEMESNEPAPSESAPNESANDESARRGE